VKLLEYLQLLLDGSVVVVPVRFKFVICGGEIEERVEGIVAELQKKGAEQDEKIRQHIPLGGLSSVLMNNGSERKSVEKGSKRSRPNHFKYGRAEWLDEVKKKINV
jgi:hypothetical protein